MLRLSSAVKTALIAAGGTVIGAALTAIVPALFRDPQLARMEREILELQRVLREDVHATPAQMQVLSEVPIEDYLALFSAAGGSQGLGKTGKSRSHAEIERLKDAITKIVSDGEATPRPLPGG